MASTCSRINVGDIVFLPERDAVDAHPRRMGRARWKPAKNLTPINTENARVVTGAGNGSLMAHVRYAAEKSGVDHPPLVLQAASHDVRKVSRVYLILDVFVPAGIRDVANHRVAPKRGRRPGNDVEGRVLVRCTLTA